MCLTFVFVQKHIIIQTLYIIVLGDMDIFFYIVSREVNDIMVHVWSKRDFVLIIA